MHNVFPEAPKDWRMLGKVLVRIGVRVLLVRPSVSVGRVMALLPGIKPKVTNLE